MDNITEFKGLKPKRGKPKKAKQVFDTYDVTKLPDVDEKGHKKPLLRAGSMESGERLYLSEKHEQYCRYRCDSYSPARAYALVYPTNGTPTNAASALERKPEIVERIKQLQMERASMAKLVDPQESLARWNEIFLRAQEDGDVAVAIAAQKQIDKINGADQAVLKQQLEIKGVFRGDTEEEWLVNAKSLFQALIEANILDKSNSFIKEKIELKEKEELEELAKIERQKEREIELERKAQFEASIPKGISPSALAQLSYDSKED